MSGIINIRDLDSEDIEIVEKLVERLRGRTSLRRGSVHKPCGFKRSAGSWKDLLDGEELKRNIYESRLVSTRPRVQL